tara:strand:+ start:1083 stop:2693 length:1611 start_codon:yes stop_codon:yes gene_type:complete
MNYEKIHQPCGDCESSDALTVNLDGSTKCFACGKYTRTQDAVNTVTLPTPLPKQVKALKERPDAFLMGFKDRRILSSTSEKYNVTQTADSQLTIYPYYDKDGCVVAEKLRTPEKKMWFEGDKSTSVLFGQQLFPKDGKVVTITEGEFDAMAAYQMLKTPCVSVRTGAQSALSDCKENFKWLDSHETIVISFDNDEAGKKAAEEVAELFGSKARVMKHRGVAESVERKDACDWLKDRKEAEFVRAWQESEWYKPEGIVTMADIRDRLLKPPELGVPWCFPTLTELTYGRRRGELFGFGAGVGVGKTDVFTQQIAFDIETLNKKVGVIYLEQNVVETAQRVMGKLDKKLYHIPDAEWTRDGYINSIDRLEARDQLYMMEHFGTMDWATIKSIIRFFNKAYGIEHIYLDHLTALSANEFDERRALDGIMADMAGLAQELGIIIHFISHLTTPDGKSHEEGGRVQEKHFTGSRAIARWSHFMFGLERNKQEENLILRQTTTFRVLKDRFTGRATGMKFGLLYNQSNGILSETALITEEAL